MSKSAIIVLVLIALGLGGTLLLVNQSKGPGSTPGESAATGLAFEIDPAQVRALTVTGSDGSSASVFKTPDRSWIYAELPVTASPDSGWPADASRVQSALRSLTPIPSAGEADQATIAESAPTVELRMEDGTVRTLQVERDSVGGNTLARIDGERLVLIRADTVNALLDAGPTAWRIGNPLAGLAADASRITVTAGDQRVALARVDNRWIMRSPISARADESVIRTVLEAILKMRITEFAGDDGLVTDPIVTVEVERDDLVQADGSARRVVSRSLAIGSAGPDSGTRRATVRGTGLPPATPLIVERGDIVTDQQFANLARPEAYLSTIAVPERTADIGIVLLRPLGDPTADRGFRRDLEGWNEMRPDGGMRTAELPDREALDQVLTLLGERSGEPRIASELDDFRPLTRVELYTLDDADLGTLQVGYSSGTLAVRRTNVIWLYPEAPIPSLFMLPAPDEVGPEPQREPDTADESDPGGNK